MEYNVSKRTEQKVIDKMAGTYFTGMLLKLETEQFGYMGMVILDCLSKGLDLWEENKEAALEQDRKRIESERAQGKLNLGQPPVSYLMENEFPQLREALNEFINELTKDTQS